MENLKEKNTNEAYSFEKERREMEKRDAKLINMIMDYAIENKMAFSEIERCIEKVKNVYLNFGLVNSQKNSVPLNISINNEKFVREIVKSINDSLTDKKI
ncbi:TPA: hypothetical protein ACOTHR_003055 [Clostridium perfringens]